jgi:Ca2+-binding RTX toxin-like protein
VIGGLRTGAQYLFGGDGDDKVWAINPGQVTENASMLSGGDDDDILYGSEGIDYLFGDFGEPGGTDTDGAIGGDDIIYTGRSSASNGDYVYAGWGDDKVYGQGQGDHLLLGSWGDDQIWGSDGDDILFGDDHSSSNAIDSTTGIYSENGVTSGDDTLYGGDGEDQIHGGAGHDYILGEAGSDKLYGGPGEDTIWGGDLNDLISTGTGWDTVFGGDGCDTIISEDGGDVLWGGDCDPAADVKGGASPPPEGQLFFIIGTGAEEENYTVIMDFWHETAMPYNHICLNADASQGIPGSGACTINPHPVALDGSVPDDCVSATDLMSGRDPQDTQEPQRTRRTGCKNDGGPLWISIDFADEESGITNSSGGGDVPRTVFGRIFQKKVSPYARRRSRRSRRYAQVQGYPAETKSDLVECYALQICTATAGGD